MTEPCRRWLCPEEATTVVAARLINGVIRTARYCGSHAEGAARAIVREAGVMATETHPIERGTTMSKKDDDFRATITRLEHESGQQKATIASRDSAIATANNEIGKIKEANNHLHQKLNAAAMQNRGLIRLLHEIANEADGEPLADNIDERLEELGLPSRKKHFEMIFTVPTQIRIEGDYPSETAMQAAFEAGEIDWNVADYEETIDDEIKIIAIGEVDQ